jgi:hypothetical protein
VGGQINVSWTAPANNGDAVKQYYLSVFENGNKTQTLMVTGTSQPVQDLSPESSYTFTVQAENKAGKSPVSAQSNAVVPYGTPDVPGGVRASNPGDHKADVSWNGISSAAFRGPGHRYEVQANGSGARSVGTATSYTYPGLNNGTSYTFQVRACNESMCSGWSAASNAVIPYGPVPTPTISASGGDRKVTFTWNGDATNGRPTTVQVSGAFTSTARTGTQSVSTGYNQTLEACVTVTDSEGQTARACDSGTSGPPPDPKAWVTPGSSINTSECTHSSCAYFVVNWQDFTPGNHTVECWSGTNPSESGWHNILTPDRSYSIDFGAASGTRQLQCFYGYPNTQVAVRIDGKLYETRTWG